MQLITRSLQISASLFLLICSAIPAAAEQYELFTYDEHETYIEITSYPPDAIGDVVIPSAIAEKPVTSIREESFIGCYRITSITLPETITVIGDGAFIGCYNLSSVTIPEGVESIGVFAFGNCHNIKSLTVPGSVANIGEGAFIGCYKLSHITISPGVETIGGLAFSNCYSVSSISLPDSLTEIGDYAFSECRSLSAISIPDNVTFIGDSAFRGCLSLSSITLPESVAVIGNSAFRNCPSLSRAIIAGNATFLGRNAFLECLSLGTVYFLGETPETGHEVFEGSPATVLHFQDYAGYTSPTWEGRTTVAIGPKPTDTPGAIQQAVWLIENNLPYNTPLDESLLISYALDLSPNTPGAPLFAFDSEALPVFQFYAGRDNISYSVEASENLIDWTSSGIAYSELGVGNVRLAQVANTGASPSFVRLRVETLD